MFQTLRHSNVTAKRFNPGAYRAAAISGQNPFKPRAARSRHHAAGSQINSFIRARRILDLRFEDDYREPNLSGLVAVSAWLVLF